jgi:hypothetical protein
VDNIKVYHEEVCCEAFVEHSFVGYCFRLSCSMYSIISVAKRLLEKFSLACDADATLVIPDDKL